MDEFEKIVGHSSPKDGYCDGRANLFPVHGLSLTKRISLVLAAVFYIFAGVMHFVKPGMYLKIMPPYVPWHEAMVYISGACEILGGIGLLVPVTRRMAALGIVALLIAVFPANLYMVTNPVEAGAAGLSPTVRWGRLPLQAVFIGWILWCSKGTNRDMPPRFHR